MRELEYLDRREAQVRQRLQTLRFGNRVQEFTRRHPVLTVGIAAAAGVVIVRTAVAAAGGAGGAARVVMRAARLGLPPSLRTIGSVLSQL